jgi:hypothetical protein
MSDRGNVSPDITQIYAFWIEVLFVPTVIFDVSATMSAALDGNPNRVTIEHSGLFAFHIVEHSIVTWRQAVRYRKAVRFIDSNPMLERKSLK